MTIEQRQNRQKRWPKNIELPTPEQIGKFSYDVIETGRAGVRCVKRRSQRPIDRAFRFGYIEQPEYDAGIRLSNMYYFLNGSPVRIVDYERFVTSLRMDALSLAEIKQKLRGDYIEALRSVGRVHARTLARFVIADLTAVECADREKLSKDSGMGIVVQALKELAYFWGLRK